jgi:hypothetical protein
MSGITAKGWAKCLALFFLHKKINSTTNGNKYGHPHLVTLARLVVSDKNRKKNIII